MQPEDSQIDVLLKRYGRDARSGAPAEHLDADELNAFAERSAPAAARSRYVSHLAECNDCRKLATQLSIAADARASVGAGAIETASGSLWQKLSSFFAPPMLRYAAFAAVLVVAVGVTFLALRNQRSNSRLIAQNEQTSQTQASAVKEGEAGAPAANKKAQTFTSPSGIISQPNATPNFDLKKDESKLADSTTAPPKPEKEVAKADQPEFAAKKAAEINFRPARVLLQDFTGVPCVVDLAAMRDALKKMHADPRRANPLIPVDLVIDHSVQVDEFGTKQAFAANALLEMQRNQERYSFLRWGQTSFSNFRVVPPDTGIVHQINLEYLASVVFTLRQGNVVQAYPDTLMGTDSHTTMINGLGVVGWGVGGIEAEACMLGQPISMLLPQVVGFKLTGRLPEGATATDLVLTITQMLRAKGVVGKFVEFHGSGVSALALADRATIANMAPEYGATIGFFPVDEQTLDYLRLSNRPSELVALVEAYTKEQGLFLTPDAG